MKGRGRPTLADIGRLAEVSPATASMILSGRSGVSFTEETVRRVRDAARALGYRTPATRRPFRLFDRRTILIICPNVVNPYYATIVQAVEQAARAEGYATLIHATYRKRENELCCLDAAENGGPAGVIFAMMPQAPERVERLGRGVPVVVIGDRNARLAVDTVELDNHSAGMLIARHMIGLGHRHIAYISTTLDADNSARVRRLEGLRETYRRECPEGAVLVRSREVTPEAELGDIDIERRVGFALAEKCLADRKLTAFVAVNDMVAYGVLDAIRAGGFRVPEDYSVCGFDNIFPSQLAGVSLTTVEHHMADKGRNAFAMLHDKIRGAASDHNITRVEFRHHLIIRGSTGPPRQ